MKGLGDFVDGLDEFEEGLDEFVFMGGLDEFLVGGRRVLE